MAQMKRFQGPGQQWATHGGYYWSAATEAHRPPRQPAAMPHSFLGMPQGMHHPVTGGLSTLVAAGVQGWRQVQKQQKKMAKGAKVPSTALGPTEQTQNAQTREAPEPLDLGAGPANYFESTGRPPPPARAPGTGNTPPPPPMRTQTAPASVTRSRLEAFKFKPPSSSIPDPF